MTQTLLVRTVLERLSRFRAFLAENLVEDWPAPDGREDAVSGQEERRRYDEYLHRGFSPFSAW